MKKAIGYILQIRTIQSFSLVPSPLPSLHYSLHVPQNQIAKTPLKSPNIKKLKQTHLNNPVLQKLRFLRFHQFNGPDYNHNQHRKIPKWPKLSKLGKTGKVYPLRLVIASFSRIPLSIWSFISSICLKIEVKQCQKFYS